MRSAPKDTRMGVRGIYWPAGVGGSLDGGSGRAQARDFLVIRCGMVPDTSVRTVLTFFFYGDRGSGTTGLKQLNVTMPNLTSLDPFTAMDRLEEAIREIGIAVFRVSGNAVAVPADADLLPGNAICVSFRAQMNCFPGVACSGAWIAETEPFLVSAKGDSVPSVLPLDQTPSPGLTNVSALVHTMPVEAAPAVQVPLPGSTVGIVGPDPRVPPTAPYAHVGPVPVDMAVVQPQGVIGPGKRRPGGASGLRSEA